MEKELLYVCNHRSRTASRPQLGLQTVGQVLAHVAKDNRLVVQMLIDGQEPDIDQIGSVRLDADRPDDLHRNEQLGGAGDQCAG
jgi:hypothetical protein